MIAYRNFKGRLGNQLFQFASMYGILKKEGTRFEIKGCFKDVYKNNFNNELKDFRLNDCFSETENLKMNMVQKAILLLIVIIEKILYLLCRKSFYDIRRQKFEIRFKKFFNKYGIVRLMDGFSEFNINSNNKSVIFSGTMESAKYFDYCRKDILNMFTPKFSPLKKNKKIYNAAKRKNSVCISIRRGDFLSSRYYSKHFVCDELYFREAVKKMNRLLSNPTYIVFSDDIEWCKNNLNFIDNAIYEDGNDPTWEKLRMMYSCSNFIISNSSFSWWAQYLSRNDSKIVIAPRKWKNDGIYNDIYQDYMVLI